MKQWIRLEDYKNCVEANQLENEINYLKNNIEVDNLIV